MGTYTISHNLYISESIICKTLLIFLLDQSILQSKQNSKHHCKYLIFALALSNDALIQ